MLKRSHFHNPPAALLNITPKPDMLKISLFADILVIMLKKKDKFYVYILWITKSYTTLKSHKKHTHREVIF